MKKVFAIAATTIALAGCGSSWQAAHNHNAPTATDSGFTHARWFWLDSPGSFQTIVYTCIGTEAIYETQDNSYPFKVVQDDPICGGTGKGYVAP